MSDLGSKSALQTDCDAKVTTNGANENTGARVRAFLTNVIDTLYANFQESSGNTATASTVNLGALKSKVTLTGTTTITSFGTADAGVTRTCIAAGVFQITHNNTTLICPGGANITTAVEDVFTAISLGSGNWIISQYQRRSGAPLNITSSITNGDTTHSPSGDAVFDALAGKAPLADPSFTGVVGIGGSMSFTSKRVITDNTGAFTAGDHIIYLNASAQPVVYTLDNPGVDGYILRIKCTRADDTVTVTGTGGPDAQGDKTFTIREAMILIWDANETTWFVF